MWNSKMVLGQSKWGEIRGRAATSHRLCKHQPVAVQVYHVEFNHAVVLWA